MAMKRGTISVIIPVYNGISWLECCVRSVLAQTWTDLEVLILDDSSTDGTGQLARQLAEEDGRIRVISREKRGVSSARNQGIEESRGEYVTFVDADDRIDRKMLEVLHEVLKKAGCDLALCGYRAWDGKEGGKTGKDRIAGIAGIEEKSPEIRNYSEKTALPDEYLSDYLLRGSARCWSVLYRREAIGGVRFREDLTIGEDMLFLMELLPNIRRVGITDYPGYDYRINPAGAMLRPFSPSYMDEIKSWRRAREIVAKRAPSRLPRADAILAVSAMLAAGKLACLPAGERRRYADCAAECRSAVKAALKTPGARRELPPGYGVKTALFLACPQGYLNLYHLWKRGSTP